jgi:ankyrin repeat protein
MLGSDTNLVTKLRNSAALLKACRENDIDVVRGLLQRGASPNCFGRHQITPLVEAASRGFESAVTLLLRYGADANAQTTCGESAVGYAAANGHTKILNALLKSGGAPDCSVILFGEKVSALTMSCGRGDMASVRLLIAAGASPNGFDEPERPIVLAARNDHLEVVRFLLQSGANVNLRSRSGKTALIPFSASGCLAGIELLLRNGVDVNLPDSDGMTPLMWACRNGHLEAVKLLVRHSADVNARDTFRKGAGIRETALGWAISRKQRDVVEWLVKRKGLASGGEDLERANAMLGNPTTR